MPPVKKKVLLMGKSGSGKTSMRSIIFANYIARDTRRLGATIEVEHSHVRLLGNLTLNLWDCGGQEGFMETYFTTQKDSIFRNVAVLIYVFDVDSREREKDAHHFQSCLECMLKNSPNAKVFCLVHKMDLIEEERKESAFNEMQSMIQNLAAPVGATCFKTSIWDETLYKAWSSVVYVLIPNVREVEKRLARFCEILDADEILLFERATFLVIGHAERGGATSSGGNSGFPSAGDGASAGAGAAAAAGGAPSQSAAAAAGANRGRGSSIEQRRSRPRDPHRFEKLSNIIKRFKLVCSEIVTDIQFLECRSSQFACFMDGFTANTHICIVTSDPDVSSLLIQNAIEQAKPEFARLEADLNADN